MLFKDSLFNLANVVGYDDTRRELVDVFVSEKKPVEELSDKDVIPKKVGIPLWDRKKTNVVEIGEVEAHIDRKSYRPIEGGCEIGVRYSGFVGTLGGFFLREKLSSGSKKAFAISKKFFSEKFLKKLESIGFSFHEEVVGLTNAHVLQTDVTKPVTGEAVLQPYNDSVGLATAVVGECSTIFKNKKNYFDVGILRLYDDVSVVNEILAPENSGVERAVKGFRDPVIDERVWKRGRTTEFTRGRVIRSGVRIKVKYTSAGEDFSAVFDDVIMCSRMGAGGDSGSLVLREDGYAVGLHFAGSDLYSFSIPMVKVAKKFSLKPLP